MIVAPVKLLFPLRNVSPIPIFLIPPTPEIVFRKITELKVESLSRETLPFRTSEPEKREVEKGLGKVELSVVVPPVPPATMMGF